MRQNKEKLIVRGFVGLAICMISIMAALTVAESFGRDWFVRLTVFACCNLLGWLIYLSLQSFILGAYEIVRIKLRGKGPEPAVPTDTTEKRIDAEPTGLSIAPELHERNRADYESKEKEEAGRRRRMVMEYIHFVMPRIADRETVDHVCGEVSRWMGDCDYTPKPIPGPLTRELGNIPLRHFIWNVSERFMYKRCYDGENRARFAKALFPREFADIDIATIRNFKVEPMKTPIPIDDPEDGRPDFHYPADYARESAD